MELENSAGFKSIVYGIHIYVHENHRLPRINGFADDSPVFHTGVLRIQHCTSGLPVECAYCTVFLMNERLQYQ